MLAGHLERGDCALSMTDSTTAEGWMQKSNFNKVGKDPVQATVRANATHHHTRLFMDAEIKGYSQWFAGKFNNVADVLSQDWHQDNEEIRANPLTQSICHACQKWEILRFKIQHTG